MTFFTASGNREVNFNLLLTGLLALVLAGPLIRVFWNATELIEVAFGGSLVLFVASLSGNMRAFWVGLAPAVVALVCAILAIVTELVAFRYLMLGAVFAFCVVAVVYVSREVFLAGAVDLNKITGSICIYLLFAIAWAIMYESLELLAPGSFTGLGPGTGHSRFDEFVYFSLVTITTLGYGDTTPTSLVAGNIAAIEAVVGVFYIAVLVASLVGDFMSRNGLRDRDL